jgi:3-methyladenine DNA glycosylase AlkD
MPTSRTAPTPDTVESLVDELRSLGTESTRKTLLRHGAKEPIFGVRIGDMQPIRKRIQGHHGLALGLYATGISDAMYLAGLVADPVRMTVADLNRWAKVADWSLLVCAVAGVASESEHGTALALKWIDDKRSWVAECGWTTLANILSITPDDQLDLAECRVLLKRVESKLASQPNRVKYAMNGFVIALGCYVPALTDEALAAADRIGRVEVDMGDTACQVPDARAYIEKVRDRGTLGKKRKSARC